MEWYSYLLAALIIMVAIGVEAMTGFGSAVVAIPFLTALVGLKTAVPLMTCVSFCYCSFSFITKFKLVVKKQLLIIVGVVLLGMPVGMLAFASLDDNILSLVLGAIVVTCAVNGLLHSLAPTQMHERKKSRALSYVALFAGGMVHGALSSGGPLIVMYSADKLGGKDSFRATMCATWSILNGVIIVKYLIVGSTFNTELGLLLLAAAPFAVIGIIIGSKLHGRINEHEFCLFVYIILAVAGVSTLVRSALSLFN